MTRKPISSAIDNKKKVLVPTITKPSTSKKDLKKRFEEEEKNSKGNAAVAITSSSAAVVVPEVVTTNNKRKKDHDLISSKASKIDSSATAGYDANEFEEEVEMEGNEEKYRKQVHIDWHAHYAALLEYQKEHGHCNVPYMDKFECDLEGYDLNGGTYHYYGALGSWLTRQRRYKRGLRGVLASDREALLQKLVDQGALLWDNSEFSATVKMKRQGEIDWPRHYAALVEYGKEYGTCNVQKKFKFEEYNCILHGLGDNGDDFHYSSKLGTWLANQRSFHNGRRGEARRLTPEREELMQRLVNEGKLLWDASEMSGTKVYGQTSWPLNYAALLQYRQLYGHCHVSQSFNFECMIPGENGQEIPYRGNLGRWLMTQRQSKKGQRNPLSPERDALLQKLQDEGVFAWEPSTAGVRAPTIRKNTFGKHIAESDWEIHYLALIEYSKIHGNCNIPQKEEFECDLPGMGEGGQTFKYKGRLGQWVRSQRQLKRALDMNESTSQKRGDKPEHKGTIQTLSPDREAKLQKLVNEDLLMWNATEQRGNKKLAVSEWNRHYAALIDYGRTHGHCNVPQVQSYECVLPGMGDDGEDYLYNSRLGIWLCTQRQAKKGMRNALAQEREELLQELVDQNMLLWDVAHLSSILKSKQHGEEEWPIHYAALVKYRDEHGSANIPQTRSYECELTAADGVDVDGVYQYSFKLGFWLSRQRHAYRCGKLSEDRIDRLQELVESGSLTWEVNDSRKLHGDSSWARHFAALVEYKKQHGTANVSLKTTYDCILPGMGDSGEDYEYSGNLGFWLNRQRQAKKGLGPGGKFLSEERTSQMQTLVDEGTLVWEVMERSENAPPRRSRREE